MRQDEIKKIMSKQLELRRRRLEINKSSQYYFTFELFDLETKELIIAPSSSLSTWKEAESEAIRLSNKLASEYPNVVFDYSIKQHKRSN